MLYNAIQCYIIRYTLKYIIIIKNNKNDKNDKNNNK